MSTVGTKLSWRSRNSDLLVGPCTYHMMGWCGVMPLWQQAPINLWDAGKGGSSFPESGVSGKCLDLVFLKWLKTSMYNIYFTLCTVWSELIVASKIGIKEFALTYAKLPKKMGLYDKLMPFKTLSLVKGWSEVCVLEVCNSQYCAELLKQQKGPAQSPGGWADEK